MPRAFRFLLSSLFLLLAVAAFADPKPFVREDMASDAVRLAETLRAQAAKTGAVTAGKAPDVLRKAAALAVANAKFDDAQKLAAAAISAAPKDAANWLLLADVAAKADDAQANDRWDLVTNGATAAYAAYERAKTPQIQAQALAALGGLLARHEQWRPALDALAASLALADNPDVRQTYGAMRAEHGFRIVDYKVDNESTAPRVCFNFSDPLARKTDFSPYVAVAGEAQTAISNEDQQLCVEGVQHGQRYEITLRQGLPSAVGEALLKDANYQIYVRDRSPQAHFAGKAYVLPRQGQEGAPLVTVNTSKVAIEVYRIGDRNLLAAVNRDDFLKPIDSSRAQELEQTDGTKVWSGSMDVADDLNKDVTTEFPILKAVGALQPGVYLVTARPWKDKAPNAEAEEESVQLATQWMVVSDLGLTAISGPGGVKALAQSLASAGPLAGVEVKLVARNNEVLATKTTGPDGRAEFDPGFSRGRGGAAPGMIVATLGDDYNFLSLTQNAFDLTDRGVGGRAAPAGLDAFVYTERGVYRSGETVFANALLRDAAGAAKPGLPLTLVAKRPDGVEYKRASVEDAGLGGHPFALPLLPGAAPGKWTILAYADPKGDPVGEVEFLLEDYIPERLDFSLRPARDYAAPGEPIAFSLDARFLYGAPASGLDVTGAVRVQATPGGALPGFPGFVAGLADDDFTPVQQPFEDKAVTDAKGRAELSVALPEEASSTRPLEAKVIVDVAEPGGRTVERTALLPVRAKAVKIGVKKDFDAAIGAGDLATFEAIAVQPDGTRVARKGAQWSLYQVTNDYQWFNADGRWSFEPVKSSKRIATGTLDIAADGIAKFSAPVQWGGHRVEVKTLDGEETSFSFDVGWSGTASADTPDNVVVTLDRADYAPGDDAKLSINARSAGKATIALVGDKLERFIDVDLAKGANVVPFKVGADWGPGAYAVALTHRPLDVAEKRMPGRAIGVAWFGIARDAHRLGVTLGAPDLARPRGPVTVPVQVAGLAAGEEAFVTVSAVDVGILNLTSFKTPDPFAFLFGQRKLPIEIRDLWGMLIDGMQGAAGAIHVGGDSGGALEGNLPTQAPLALFSGVVKVGPDGKAAVSFDLPAFNGAVRLAAVAWSKDKVGAAQQDVAVRDRIVVAATTPRFLNVGDRSQIHVEIDNVEGAAGDYTLDLDMRGPVTADAAALRRTVRLEPGKRASADMAIAAAGVGVADLDLTLTGADTKLAQHLALGITSGAPNVFRRTATKLPPGASEAVAATLLADFVPQTGSVSVAASPFGALDAPALLKALDLYPYGCSEQTVSRALPLLYVNRIAALENLGVDPDIDPRIRAAIDKELSRQSASGAFGMWTADSGDEPWLDAYVTDFLTRARERNFAVPEAALAQALDRLRNTAANAAEPNKDNADALAYALYVLARNGRPVIGDVRYLADAKLDAFPTPLAKAQLGGALAMLGDRARAGKVFAAALTALEAERDTGDGRSDFGSRLRDAAAVLALIGEADPAKGDLPRDGVERAASVLAAARAERTLLSTQEMNWMVLAAAALAQTSAEAAFSVDGAREKGALFRRWNEAAFDRKPILIANAGETPADLIVTASGAPIAPEPALAHGYEVERSFYKLDGTKTDLASVAQNDRVVVALKVTETEARRARLLIVDRLPAGLEIDNPALVDGAQLGAFDWLVNDAPVAHTEYRDDRFVAVLDRAPGQSAFINLAYVVRAVSPGRYIHPPATAEDMYNPERFGRTAFGEAEVKGR